jgi:hypothetical protein
MLNNIYYKLRDTKECLLINLMVYVYGKRWFFKKLKQFYVESCLNIIL